MKMPAPCLAPRGIAIGLAMNLMVVVFSSDAAFAVNDVHRFDIRAQSLPAALAEFAERTGMATLVDAKLTDGKRSTTVSGKLVPREALRILLAGTGLSFREIGDTSFAVGPNTSAPPDDEQREKIAHGKFDPYFARLRTTIERSVCGNPAIRMDAYRAVVQLWIGPAGTIDAVHPVSAGSEDERAIIVDTVARMRLAPPPAGLPQPVTVMVRRGNANETCRGHLADVP
jgi:Secretin and TonB N terminus short domain